MLLTGLPWLLADPKAVLDSANLSAPPHPAPHVHLLSMDDLDDTFEINI